MSLLIPDDRDPVEFLAEQFLERHRRGLNPSIGDYVAHYPDLAGPIRELFPAMLALEMLKDGGMGRGGGNATLGLRSPDRIGPYQLIREIGRGGMGVVYEARDTRDRRRLAVKVLARSTSRHVRLLRREMRLTSRLRHPGIVPILECGDLEGFHFLVMQFIRGADWERIFRAVRERVEVARAVDRNQSCNVENGVVKRRVFRRQCLEADWFASHLLSDTEPVDLARAVPRIYWRRVATMGLQVAEVLERAHATRTWHRDIKPANLLLSRDAKVWVTDFGLGKALDDESGTRSGRLVGTLRYLAPEQFAGTSDHRSDLYSLGVSLFELATLQSVYWETSRSQMLHRITQESLPAAREIVPEIPAELDGILQRATARRPQDRFQTAADFVSALKPLALPKAFGDS